MCTLKFIGRAKRIAMHTSGTRDGIPPGWQDSAWPAGHGVTKHDGGALQTAYIDDVVGCGRQCDAGGQLHALQVVTCAIIERDGQVRRLLFVAGCHGSRHSADASSPCFPGGLLSDAGSVSRFAADRSTDDGKPVRMQLARCCSVM